MASDRLDPGVYVGVDSGGTRTNLTIEIVREEGTTIVETDETTESLSGALDLELLQGTLRAILGRLERFGGRHSLAEMPAYVWVSAAGFTPWTRKDYFEAMRLLIPALLGGAIRRAGAANDGVSLLLGHRSQAVVIAGTGSTVIVRSPNGELRQSGGHEWVACDDGSGFWIGLKAVRRAYRHYEAGDVESALVSRFRETYDIPQKSDSRLLEKLRDLAVSTKDTKKEIARFARHVCDAAEIGDKEAQDIVKGEAEALADVTAVILRRTFTDGIPSDLQMVECGGILANDFYRTTFENQVSMRLRSDDGREVRPDLRRVKTGGAAAVRLAKDLATDLSVFDGLGEGFAPAIIDRT